MKLAPSAITDWPAFAPSVWSDFVSEMTARNFLPSTPHLALKSAMAISAPLSGGPSYAFIHPLNATAKPITISLSAAYAGDCTPMAAMTAAVTAPNDNFRITTPPDIFSRHDTRAMDRPASKAHPPTGNFFRNQLANSARSVPMLESMRLDNDIPMRAPGNDWHQHDCITVLAGLTAIPSRLTNERAVRATSSALGPSPWMRIA